jgi:phage shock protein A
MELTGDTVTSVDEHGDTEALVAALIVRTSEMSADIERLKRRLQAVQTSLENSETEVARLRTKLTDVQAGLLIAAQA